MPAIWNDPIGWSSSTVATPTRMWLFIMLTSSYHLLIMYQVLALDGRGAVVGIAFMLFMQCLFIYALRSTYAKLKRKQLATAA